MSELQTIKNIKIPFPVEGVIRTAQLDDMVAPEDSVQLAVNMNFDRVGALQTRPGVTEYADDLTGPIKNFGTLNNSTILDGYNNIKKFAETNAFGESVSDLSVAKVDDTHFIVFWSGAGADGFVQCVELDPDTGVVTLLGTPLEFDTSNGENNACHRIDSEHFINFWTGASGDGFVQVFTVNSSTYEVTALGTPLEFDTADSSFNSVAQIDANHFINFYRGTAGDGFASNFEVNLGTWAVTEVGSPLTFDATTANFMSVSPLGDGEHVIVFWQHNAAEGYAQVFEINTGTWNTTALGTPLTFDSITSENQSFSLGDGEHFVNTWNGPSSKGLSRVFNVNLSTFAVTAAGAEFEIDSLFASNLAAVSVGDGEHFVVFWAGVGSDSYTQVFEINTTTYEITEFSTQVFYADISNPNVAILADPYTILNFWGSTASAPGTFVNAAFYLYGDIQFNNLLYAQDGDSDIYNWNGATWTLRRSNLNTTQKARFAQYLNYIWMVNGGDTLGDAVQTSNGGNFGTDLVPTGFPPGDFISAGFEGRVWVADSGFDVIYYTDIVQFTPPDTYTLTFDVETNFIKTLSPQDGQKITALMRVPRALLVFKQDSIYRIYGATSVDSYPAYNVGTYSQESIVTTKTGIFFHHSSGFYQFDYGSQPIEISRRVIDFVKAIPRSYYEDITGVYDGFDAVEWSVGSVTVEGVTFSNCVMRYTISTQVWTIYDYVGNTITAMIQFDDGTDLVHLMGTAAGKTGSMDDGETDFGASFYFEYIDRWRAFTEMICQVKNIGAVNVYSENAGGVNFMYQIQKTGPNVWESIGTINEKNNSLFPTVDIGDFDVIRFRTAGTTSGVPVVIHGFEVLELTIKGFDEN